MAHSMKRFLFDGLRGAIQAQTKVAASNLISRSSIDSHPSKTYHLLNQIRCMGRNDGARFVMKPKPVSKKQKKKYNRRMKEILLEKVEKHSKPGSKAGPRREFMEDQLKYHADKAAGKFPKHFEPGELEYDMGDAILDDLMGNTSHLTSMPNPKPVFLGGKFETYHSTISKIMKEYNQFINDREANHSKGTLAPPLPSDYQLSLLLRAYRDHASTSRSKPMGVAPVLRLLFQELNVPSVALNELCYTTLMTCASTPTEGRRIMKMMKDHNHPISSYSYSILVHIHSKRGDFRGAAEVLSEMNLERIQPSLAAYTSFLAGCYKICNQGAVSQAVKAEAGKLAWEKWKEMRIIGLDPDVMTYGAMIRIMAARGLPEQALNILEEMQAANVKPTPLIFSSALKAVARSHANALRFHGGRSSKNKRRELITAHHGNMTRAIVIAADNARVDQDDSFVSALMLCAATAGDSATVKAIYLASEIRKLDSLRPIGGPEHLKLLQGSDGGERQFNFINGSALDNALDELTDTAMKEPCSFEEREYGRDTRVLSGLLYAYALAMDPGGLGNMWSGKENRGYLCANSLRLINKRRVPEYVDTSIPGMSGTETGLSSLNWEWADDHTDGRLSKKEERNLTRKIKEYDHAGNRIDELDPMFFRMHMNDDDEKEKRSQRNDLKPSNSPVNAQPDLPIDGFGKTVRSGPIFNNLKEINRFQQPVDDSVDDSYDNAVQEFEYDIADVPDLDSTDFDSFYKKLTDEFVADGEENSLDEESARELFDLIKVHQAEEKSQLSTDEDEGEAFVEGTMRGIEEKTSGFGAVEKGPEILAMNSVEKSGDFDSRADRMLHELSILKENMVNLVNPVESTSFSSISSKSGDELALLLEGFPAHRVKKVREVFSSSLGSPSILSLVPAVREIMPERITNSWLKRKNVVDAYAAMESANDNEAVDIHILNSMLQVLSKSGSIDKTLLFYEKEFHARNLTPNSYTDRIVLQMLVDCKRISRALEFKSKVEATGRNIDLLAYGSLIEYYGNRGEIGDAIIMLKECLSIHGTPPGEKCLKQLRLFCRQRGIEDEINLKNLIGVDPMAWLREGERDLKREYSKKGRRQVDLARNRLLKV